MKDENYLLIGKNIQEHSIENTHNGSSRIHMIVRIPEKQFN